MLLTYMDKKRTPDKILSQQSYCDGFFANLKIT